MTSYSPDSEESKNLLIRYKNYLATDEGYEVTFAIVQTECELMGSCIAYNAPLKHANGEFFVCRISVSRKHPHITPKISIVDKKTGLDQFGFTRIGEFWHQIQDLHNCGFNWMDLLPEEFIHTIDRDAINQAFTNFLTQIDTHTISAKDNLVH